MSDPIATDPLGTPEMPAPRITERRALGMPGLPFLLLALVALAGGIALGAGGFRRRGVQA